MNSNGSNGNGDGKNDASNGASKISGFGIKRTDHWTASGVDAGLPPLPVTEAPIAGEVMLVVRRCEYCGGPIPVRAYQNNTDVIACRPSCAGRLFKKKYPRLWKTKEEL